MADVVVIGPWGGLGGYDSFYFKPDGRIVEIHISSGDIVDSISFSYTDKDGDKNQSEKYGGEGGSLDTISIAEEEDIIGISGTFRENSSNLNVITSLTFQTNKETYGPYGVEEGEESFWVPVVKGKFVGFHGKYGDYLDSFGVILSPE